MKKIFAMMFIATMAILTACGGSGFNNDKVEDILNQLSYGEIDDTPDVTKQLAEQALAYIQTSNQMDEELAAKYPDRDEYYDAWRKATSSVSELGEYLTRHKRDIPVDLLEQIEKAQKENRVLVIW